MASKYPAYYLTPTAESAAVAPHIQKNSPTLELTKVGPHQEEDIKTISILETTEHHY